MDLTTRKTLTIGNGPVVPPKTRHFKFTILAPIKYLSSDHTMTWSVRTLCSCSPSFTSRYQICDPNNICCVAIENPQIALKRSCYFTAIQQLLFQSQIWTQEVEEQLKLHNKCIDDVMICWDLRYLIGVKVAGTVKRNCGAGITRPKHRGFMSSQGSNPATTKGVGCLVGSRTEENQSSGQKPVSWLVTRTRC